MGKNPHFDFSHLTAEERIRLAQDLWDSLEPDDADLPLTKDQYAELERRLEAYRRDPKAGSSWEEVEARAMQAVKAVRAKSA